MRFATGETCQWRKSSVKWTRYTTVPVTFTDVMGETCALMILRTTSIFAIWQPIIKITCSHLHGRDTMVLVLETDTFVTNTLIYSSRPVLLLTLHTPPIKMLRVRALKAHHGTHPLHSEISSFSRFIQVLPFWLLPQHFFLFMTRPGASFRSPLVVHLTSIGHEIYKSLKHTALPPATPYLRKSHNMKCKNPPQRVHHHNHNQPCRT